MSKRWWRAYAWLLGVLWGLPLCVTGIGLLVLPHDRSPSAECGVCFSPAEGLSVVVYVVAGAVLIPAGVIGNLLIAGVQIVRATRGHRDG